MAEAGFAEADDVATETTSTEPQAPIDPAEQTIDTLSAMIQDASGALSRNVQGLLPANQRRDIVRAEIHKLLAEKHGDPIVDFVKENTWMYTRLEENYGSQITDAVSAAVSDAYDEIADTHIANAARFINAQNLEDAFASSNKFVAWVDCFVRNSFQIITTQHSAPNSITFELSGGADEPAPNGVKMVFLWRNGGGGVLRGSSAVVHGFPWIGRKLLHIAADADEAAKTLAKGYRRMYAKAVLIKLSESFPR